MPLRVLLLITRGEPGGAQLHVLELVRALRGEVEYQVVVGDDEWLSGELRALGVAVEVLPSLQRSVDPRADVRTLAALRALIRRVRPHLVHTHSTKAGVLGRLAGRSLGVPVLHTAHAWSFSDGLPWSRRAFAIPVEAALGRVTDRFIAVSEADREVAVRWHVARPDQVEVIHNGIPDVAERAEPAAPEPVVVMVARMAAPKDHRLLLEAVAEVPGLRLRLVGDGPDRPAVEAAVRELGLADRAELLGVRRDVAAILAQAQVCALVSRQEGFPLAVLEGMRAGLPVVASDVGGIREAITDGVHGYLVPRGDKAALRDRLSHLAKSPDLRATMGRAGRNSWDEHFRASVTASRTLAEYAKVANNGAPGTPGPPPRSESRETRTQRP